MDDNLSACCVCFSVWFVSVDDVCVCVCVYEVLHACARLLVCVWCVSVLCKCVHVGGTNWCILYIFAIEQVAHEVLMFLVKQ